MLLLADDVRRAVTAKYGDKLLRPNDEVKTQIAADIRDAVQKLLGRAVKINFVAATGAASGAASGPSAAPTNAPAAEPSPGDDPLTQEALGHPEVQRFQQTFPGSHVRTVRNLRD